MFKVVFAMCIFKCVMRISVTGHIAFSAMMTFILTDSIVSLIHCLHLCVTCHLLRIRNMLGIGTVIVKDFKKYNLIIYGIHSQESINYLG